MPQKIYSYRKPLSRTKYILIKTISNIFIFLGIIFLFLAFGPIIKDEVWYGIKTIKGQEITLKSDGGEKVSVFAKYLSSKPIVIEPVNRDFSIVIEKIGVNAPIVRDVPVTDSKAYFEALKYGVAHASVSQYPSKNPGNVYLFAHSSVNFWQLGKYAKVFNLLRKLDISDKIYIIYEDKVYTYRVVNKEVLKGWNTYPLTRKVIEPTLTLQTCDPPGTTINRLVVTAKLVDVSDFE